MKKILVFLTSFFSLITSAVEPSAHLAAAADSSISSVTSTTATPTSSSVSSSSSISSSNEEEAKEETIIDSSFFASYYNRSDLPTASVYKPLENAEDETDKLNYALTSTKVNRIGGVGKDHPTFDKPNKAVEFPGVKVQESQDIINAYLGQINDPVFTRTPDNELTFMAVDGVNYTGAFDTVVENYNVALYYQQAKPAVYFNSLPGKKKDISFYIDPNFDGRALQDLIIKYGLEGGLIFLQIDNEPILKLAMDGSEFKIIAAKGVQLSYENLVINAAPANLKFPILKVTIPYRSSISNVVGLRMAIVEEKANIASYTLPETMVFAFHEDMSEDTFFYFFNIKSLSVVNKTLAIEDNTYTDFRLSASEKIDKSKMSASLVSMTLFFSGSTRVKDTGQTLGDDLYYKGTQISSTGAKISIISLPETHTYECTFTRQSETSGNWLYETTEEIPTTSSGQIKIYTITFHPVIDGEIREDLTFTQDYRKTELFKYSFDMKKAARIYYYNCVSYYTRFTRNDKMTTFESIVSKIPGVAGVFWLGYGTQQIIDNSRQNWQTFAFSFYFDDDKKEAIPDVQKIVLKWQCGFEKANPEEDSGGFYNGYQNDPYKKIHIETKTVNENRLPNGTYALDNDGMFLSDKDSCEEHFTDKGKYDYAIAKLHKRGDKTYNTYISMMAPLEIYYETVSGELVRMVGNSRGLHVVQDDDGNDIVVDSEGIAPAGDDVYGIFTAEDGTKIPGIDKNGDGEISEDETINSDTGEFEINTNPNDGNSLTNLEEWWKKFSKSLSKAAKDPRTWIWTIVILITIAIVLIAIFKPEILINAYNSWKKVHAERKKAREEKKKKKSSSKSSVKKKTKSNSKSKTKSKSKRKHR